MLAGVPATMILAEFLSGNAIRSHYGLGSKVFEQNCIAAKLGVLPNREALTRTTLYSPAVVESIKPVFFLITENLIYRDKSTRQHQNQNIIKEWYESEID